MLSTALSGVSIVDPDATAELLPASTEGLHTHRRLTVSITAGAGMFVSVDGGMLWLFVSPSNPTRSFDYLYEGLPVLIKAFQRNVMSGVFADLV